MISCDTRTTLLPATKFIGFREMRLSRAPVPDAFQGVGNVIITANRWRW